MSKPLTREQVAEQLHVLYLAKAYDLGWPVRHECDVPYDRLTPDGQALDLMFADWHLTQTATLRQQLATVTQERDKFERKYELILNDQDYQQCCELRNLAEQQLATARREVWEAAAQELENCILVAGASGRNKIDVPFFITWCREQARKAQP